MDAIALLATFVGGAARFGAPPAQLLRGPMYLALAATLPVVWVGAMFLGRSYDRRYLAAGAEQFRRVANSAMWVLGIVAFVSFVLHADFSRVFVAITIPVATALTLLARWEARAILRKRFDRGAAHAPCCRRRRLCGNGPTRAPTSRATDTQDSRWSAPLRATRRPTCPLTSTNSLPTCDAPMLTPSRSSEPDASARASCAGSPGHCRVRVSVCSWSRISRTSPDHASRSTRSKGSHCWRSVSPS